MKLASIEKDKQPSQEILRLFEKTRVAYLSARSDPTEYSGRWRKAVDTIIESYNEADAAGKEMKNFIDEKDLNVFAISLICLIYNDFDLPGLCTNVLI